LALSSQSVVLLLAVALAAAWAVPASAEAPLIGQMDLQFNKAWPGPQAEIPDWVGTITIDGDEYGMAFFALGTGKPFETDPSTSVHFFEEIWTIYDEVDFAFNAASELTRFEPGDVVLSGSDYGISNLVNLKYHMNGRVNDAAGPFAEWLGRSVHMSGVLEGFPDQVEWYAPGVLRIN
jgi:hypothetical protein